MAKKILIIDDEPTIVMILDELLSEQGYDILKAYSGEEGLRLFNSKTPPDLVITDLKMPGISGKAVIQAIRENPKEIPIIIVTGCVMNGDFPEEGSYQAIFYKPFDIEKFKDNNYRQDKEVKGTLCLTYPFNYG